MRKLSGSGGALLLAMNISFASFTPTENITSSATKTLSSEASIAVSSDVAYQYIGQYPVSALNDILTTQLKQFSNANIIYPKPKYAVNLYSITYTTVIPEKNNRSTVAQGLIAIPVMPNKIQMPIVSYQHGTIFEKNQVPSQLNNSMETKLMVANFAGQGYVLIAPDYIGQGTNNEPNAWMVKDISAQESYDMLLTSKEVLKHLGLETENLFLSGWSQGTMNTLALMQKLEQNNIPVKGVAVSASPNDIYATMSRWIFEPSPLDASYLVGTVAMVVFAYENYYGFAGLAQSAIKPEYYQTAKEFYDYKISWEEAGKVFPATSKDLLTPEFESALASGISLFAKQLKANALYNWQYKTPVHIYYGERDEVMTPYLQELSVQYQKTIGGVVPVTINAGSEADHRATFLFGMRNQKIWFDDLVLSQSTVPAK